MILTGTRADLEKKASVILEKSIGNLLSKQGKVVLAVVGGSSVSNVFTHLQSASLDWKRIHLFMVDERLVPIAHPESNYGLAASHFSQIFPPENLHPFVYDSKSRDLGVRKYEQLLEKLGGKFDVALTSSGEDGHIGALFPKHQSIESDNSYFVTMDDSPKPPSGRMSATKKLIQRGQVGFVLFFGAAKKEAYCNFINEKMSIRDCPSKLIRQLPEHYILVDQEAGE